MIGTVLGFAVGFGAGFVVAVVAVIWLETRGSTDTTPW